MRLALSLYDATMKRMFSSRRAALAAVVVAMLALPTITPPAEAADCQFVLGFRTLHGAIPDVVGDCLENEVDGPSSASQRTTNGTLRFAYFKPGQSMAYFDASDASNVQYSLVGHADCVGNMGGVWIPPGVCISLNTVIAFPRSVVNSGVSLKAICEEGQGNVYLQPGSCFIKYPN